MLNTAPDRRLKNLDEQLMAFPYGNGLLFAETLPHASFDSRIRQGLLHCTGSQLQAMPEAIKRIKAVQQTRLASRSLPTQQLAATPTRFHVENFPERPYLVIPKVSSQRRKYSPIGFEQPSTFASDLLNVLADATLFHFGILSSLMHNAWMRTVCGRLKSDHRYSVGIVYNNFPWPLDPDRKQCQAVEAAARAVLDARGLRLRLFSS